MRVILHFDCALSGAEPLRDLQLTEQSNTHIALLSIIFEASYLDCFETRITAHISTTQLPLRMNIVLMTASGSLLNSLIEKLMALLVFSFISFATFA